MATREERAERAIDSALRLGISLILPLWGLVMIVLGLRHGSLWWLGSGVAVMGVGAVMMVASPLIRPLIGGIRGER
jgi:hypothetical protein